MNPINPILLVDDMDVNIQLLKKFLNTAGFDNLLTCTSGRQALDMLERYSIEVALYDLVMPDISGQDLLKKTQKGYPGIPVIIVTASDDIKSAVECMKSGAFDFLEKPIEQNLLFASLKRALRVRQLERELNELKIKSDTLKNPEIFKNIITRSEKMIEVFHSIEAVAPSIRSVLITGETGVGKEMVAKAIHELSGRSGKFIPVNAAGLDDNLFSDTLFGHLKGAFTGAERDKKGIVELAAKGTLFLDEIGDLSLVSQVKLLRLLQENEYQPLGSDTPKKSEVRIVVATNKDLWQLQQNGRFREDLNYRLRTHHIHLPALRERMEDLPLLVDHFLVQSAQELGRKKPTAPKELIDLLRTYSFPGNIRELQAVIFDAVSRHRSKVMSLNVFKNYIMPEITKANHSASQFITFHESLPTLQQTSRLLIKEAMKRSKNNQSIAASMLGISQSALSRRLKGKEL